MARRDSVDHGAIGQHGAMEERIIALADWQADHCSCPSERWDPDLQKWVRAAHRSGCSRPRERVAENRHQSPGHHSRHLCYDCESPPNWALWESALRSGRYGVEKPMDGCAGCVFADLGELEMDKSLRAAFGL